MAQYTKVVVAPVATELLPLLDASAPPPGVSILTVTPVSGQVRLPSRVAVVVQQGDYVAYDKYGHATGVLTAAEVSALWEQVPELSKKGKG